MPIPSRALRNGGEGVETRGGEQYRLNYLIRIQAYILCR